ncbi:hypothetical protein LPICM02_150003 [Pseudolactococcus piscium]|nr:hypothetical protein LPICM02_150003 [Lactococcus piscium]
MPFVFLLYAANLIFIVIGIPFVFVVIYALILSILGDSTLLCGIETCLGELFP